MSGAKVRSIGVELLCYLGITCKGRGAYAPLPLQVMHLMQRVGASLTRSDLLLL